MAVPPQARFMFAFIYVSPPLLSHTNNPQPTRLTRYGVNKFDNNDATKWGSLNDTALRDSWKRARPAITGFRPGSCDQVAGMCQQAWLRGRLWSWLCTQSLVLRLHGGLLLSSCSGLRSTPLPTPPPPSCNTHACRLVRTSQRSQTQTPSAHRILQISRRGRGKRRVFCRV